MKGIANQYKSMSIGKHSFREPLRAGAKLVSGNIIRRFDKEEDPNGNRWKPLSKKYAKQKLKKYRGKRSKINVDTSIMRQSITSNASASAVYDLSTDRITFGTAVEYAKYAQSIRPFIGMSKSDIKEIGELFDIWLEKLYITESKK